MLIQAYWTVLENWKTATHLKELSFLLIGNKPERRKKVKNKVRYHFLHVFPYKASISGAFFIGGDMISDPLPLRLAKVPVPFEIYHAPVFVVIEQSEIMVTVPTVATTR